MLVLVLSGLLAASSLVEAHVALTFPPARKYDLDFLDTFRTVGPCGMNKGSIKTTLKSGETMDVTWHLGYPHGGGYMLELLDNKEQTLHNFTDGFLGAENNKIQKAQISLPAGLTCPDCTIRLSRQAKEWGENYRFQSCADVDIVAEENYQNTCSNHGSFSGSLCTCQHTYFGDQCQYKNDCENDLDCNNHGQCIEHGGSSNPQKECYCDFGYFGRNCEKISPINSKVYNESDFRTIDLSPGTFKFLWRYLSQDEIEMEGIVVARTNSFVAIGWRPDDLDKSCQKFPKDAPAPIGKDFHPMDCQDIVVGKIKGDRSNIGDYYTRDRSTPRQDEVYGGKNDLLGAAGWEADGLTTMWFRKKVDSGDDADHEFYGKLRLIWAHGRSDDPFYKDDELKYHGGNRGQYVLHSGASKLSQQRQLLIGGVILILIVMSFQAAQNLEESFVAARKADPSSCFPCCTTRSNTTELKAMS